MPSHKLRELVAQEEEEVNIQAFIASMIDLIFLLIIFFMITSKKISLAVDRRVEPPIASNAETPNDIDGRITINILKDGRIIGTIENENVELSTSDSITEHVLAIRSRNDETGIKTKLNLRTDKESETRMMKKVITAAGTAGVNEVIFSSLPEEK